MRTSLALLIAIAGCGDDGGSLPDAPLPPSDGMPDAGGPSVKLTITDGSVPAVGATVYFQNPDSSLVAKVMTDVDGVAIAVMPDGGYVTAIEPRVAAAFGAIVLRDRLSTFAGVKPGDDLHLDLRPSREETTVSFMVTIPPDPGAEEYRLYAPCGSWTLGITPPPTPVPASLTGCPATTDMIVIASDTFGRPMRAVYMPNQQVTEGALIVFPAPYIDATPVTVDVASSPPWVDRYAVEIDVMGPHGRLFGAFADIDPSAATSAVLGVPGMAGTTALLRADAYSTQPAFERQTLGAWGLPFTAQTIDMGTRAARQLTSAPVYDPTMRTVSWTDAAGLTPDVVRTEVYTYREGDPATAWHWQIVSPYSGTSMTYPVLQGDAATAFTTTAADSFNVTNLETLVISGGYDRIRSHSLRRAFDVAFQGPPGQFTYQRLEESVLLAPFTRGTR